MKEDEIEHKAFIERLCNILIKSGRRMVELLGYGETSSKAYEILVDLQDDIMTEYINYYHLEDKD